jgi:hypothetical protein
MTVDTSGNVSWSVPASASGAYAAVLSATDAAGNTGTQAFTIGVATGSGGTPTVSLTLPVEGAMFVGFGNAPSFTVRGTATSPALAGYHLDLCLAGLGAGCIRAADGLGPVSSGTLGTVDAGRFANGYWELRLTAVDASGAQSTTSVHVLVGRIPPFSLTSGQPAGIVNPPAIDIVDFPGSTVGRTYEGLAPSAVGPGRGWSVAWLPAPIQSLLTTARAQRPNPLGSGWAVILAGGFIPQFQIDPTYDHLLILPFADGRIYEFDVAFVTDNTIASILPAYPTVTELTATGATLQLLDGTFRAYSTTDFSDNLSIGSGLDFIFQNFDATNLWEPAYYRLTTEFGEVYTFASAGSLVRAQHTTLSAGPLVDLTGPSVTVGGVSSYTVIGTGGLVDSITSVLNGQRVSFTRNTAGDLVRASGPHEIDAFAYGPAGDLLSYVRRQGP